MAGPPGKNLPAFRPPFPGAGAASAELPAAVNVPRRRKLRRLRLPRQPSVPCSDTSLGSGLMVDPPFGSSRFRSGRMVNLDENLAKNVSLALPHP